jgi:hypothetical protein
MMKVALEEVPARSAFTVEAWERVSAREHGERIEAMENKLISVAGRIFDNARDAAREISALSHKKVAEELVDTHLREHRRGLNGIPVSYAPPLKPVKTGVPLAVRVWREWVRQSRSETGGYPRNKPSRSALLRWNPYTARYGVRP